MDEAYFGTELPQKGFILKIYIFLALIIGGMRTALIYNLLVLLCSKVR